MGFDTETTGLDVYSGKDHVIGFSLAVRVGALGIVKDYFPINHRHGGNIPDEVWRPFMELVISKLLIIHNSPFDITGMANLGFNITRFFDTLKYGHLLNENRANYSLDMTCLHYLGYKGKLRSPMFETALLAYGWDMPVMYMKEYAAEDAALLILLAEKMLAETTKHSESKLPDFWKQIEVPALIGLTHMRKWGVEIDVDLCKREEAKGLAIKEEITDFFGFNPGSSIGLKKLLIDQLGFPILAQSEKTGAPSFTKDVMERYELLLNPESLTGGDSTADVSRSADEKRIVQQLLTYRGWTKSVSGYYKSYQDHVSEDGRLRAEYKPHGTKTGRYSCANPNLQQIPKETNKVWNGAVKECLVSATGYTGWEIDYSQLEFRLAASASHSESLLNIFSDSARDIFTEMAKELGWARQATKGFTYSTLYGAGTQRIMDVFGVTAAVARDLIEHFYATYPDLRLASRAMSNKAKQTGQVDIWSGRRRHFSNPASEYFKAFNSFIQGGAADIVKNVMNTCFREIVSEDCRLLLQVHDSLWFEIREGYESYYLPKIQEIMTRPSARFGVQLDVDIHSWSQREEQKVPTNWKELYVPETSKMLTV